MRNCFSVGEKVFSIQSLCSEMQDMRLETATANFFKLLGLSSHHFHG